VKSEIFNELTTKFFANEALPIVQIKFYTDHDNGEANSQGTVSGGNSSVFILQPTAMKIYEGKIRFLIPALNKQVDNNYIGNGPMPDEPAAAISISEDSKVLEMKSDGYWNAYTYPYRSSSDSSYV
jgi:hypothetical protein